MARTLRNAKIDTRSARSKLPVAKTIYWVPLTHGYALGYRKGAKGGAWVAKYVMPDKRPFRAFHMSAQCLHSGRYADLHRD